MALSRLWRVAVVAVFLLAQQSAVAHQLWHVASPSSQAAGNTNPLCDQHGALDSVLGALSGLAALPALDEVAFLQPSDAPYPSARLEALSPSSRGPPASL